MTSHIKQPPKAVGLSDPRFKHDACSAGRVVRLDDTLTEPHLRRSLEAPLMRTVRDEGRRAFDWHEGPANEKLVGTGAAKTCEQAAFERKLYVLGRTSDLIATEPRTVDDERTASRRRMAPGGQLFRALCVPVQEVVEAPLSGQHGQPTRCGSGSRPPRSGRSPT